MSKSVDILKALKLGGFHMEKIVIACCGSYLANTGIENVLEEHETTVLAWLSLSCLEAITFVGKESSYF